MNQWRATGMKLQDLEPRKIHPLNMEGKQLAIIRLDDLAYAVSAICPHASGDLCQGRLDHRDHLVCPVHFYRFDPINGRNTSGEEYKLKTYPIEIRNHELFVFF